MNQNLRKNTKTNEKSSLIGLVITFEKRAQCADERIFDLDGMYNSQNQRIWASSRDEADEKDGIKEKQQFPQKIMVWLGVCSKGVTPFVIFDRETVDHVVYIQKALPVALKYGNKTFGKH